MDSKSLLSNRFSAQVKKFSGILSKDLSQPCKGFMYDMLFGIQKAKDIKLSEISRALCEDIALIKTENRLSRNLMNFDLSEHINNELCRLSSSKLHADDVIAIDPGDISKPYAKEMEHLCGIWDGSHQKGARGYHLCQIVIANTEHTKVVPCYSHLWSSEEENYQGKQAEIFKAIDTLTKHVGNKGIWAIDREGDDNSIIKKFIDDEKTFVTRLKYNRLILYKKSFVTMQQFTKTIETPHKAKIISYEENKVEKEVNIEYGAEKIHLNGIKETLIALVVKGFGENPMVLITNQQLSLYDANQCYKILDNYLTRWKCDETYRYVKQAYNLEDVRVRKIIAIKNTVALVMAVAYFAMIYMGASLKLKIMKEKIFVLAKRFFAIPVFFCYSMADGIYNLLKSHNSSINKKEKPPNSFQLLFNFD